MSILIQRLIRLRHMISVLFVCSHIYNFIRNHRIIRITLIHLAVRCLYESVFVNSRIGSKGVDQTNVRTFRRLDRTHSSVVGIVYVTHLKSGTVSGKTTRSQGGKTSLMGQLRQWIVLIHKL